MKMLLNNNYYLLLWIVLGEEISSAGDLTNHIFLTLFKPLFLFCLHSLIALKQLYR